MKKKQKEQKVKEQKKKPRAVSDDSGLFNNSFDPANMYTVFQGIAELAELVKQKAADDGCDVNDLLYIIETLSPADYEYDKDEYQKATTDITKVCTDTQRRYLFGHFLKRLTEIITNAKDFCFPAVGENQPFNENQFQKEPYHNALVRVFCGLCFCLTPHWTMTGDEWARAEKRRPLPSEVQQQKQRTIVAGKSIAAVVSANSTNNNNDDK